MNKTILILLCAFLFTGCASKRYTKKASKFEEAGLYKDAAEYYYEAVKRKDSNVDAKLGLRKNGQLTLDNKLAVFMDYYKQANYKQAVYVYLNADEYYHKIKAVGVDLIFPENTRAYYEEAKSDFLGKKYIQGSELLDREEFSASLSIFTEIINIDENYKDIKEKYTIARYEPKYREGINLLDKAKYRKAYYTFDYILNGAGDYKQAFILKEESREKGTLAIIVTDFTYTKKQNRGVASHLTTKVRENINGLDNPFLKLVDPLTLDVAIFKYGGEVDMQAAHLAGVHAILFAEINDHKKFESKLKKTPKKGYIKEVIKLRNDEGGETESIIYHKTKYTEFEAKNEASLNLTYKMVSTLNSELLISDGFSRKKEDEVHYAVFDGKKKNLVPGYWKYKDKRSVEDVVRNEKKEVRALKRLLDSKHKIKTATAMLNELIEQSVKSITSKVDAYNPEKE
ncbi:MAG: hypothetical protein K8S16_13455 [Bacteroidales bacterium]|nr:hypothetical protein [Bacteroidales bacterium]